MNQSLIILLALIGFVATVIGAPVVDLTDTNTREGCAKAFASGMETFGGRIAKRKEPVVEAPAKPEKKIIYSEYTKDIESPSGGKPALAEQYINHKFEGYKTTVVPRDLPPIIGRETAEDAKLRHVPGPLYQYTTERLRV